MGVAVNNYANLAKSNQMTVAEAQKTGKGNTAAMPVRP